MKRCVLLSERCEAEGGGPCCFEPSLQDCRCPRLPADPAPQQPGRAPVKKPFSGVCGEKEPFSWTSLFFVCFLLRVQDSTSERDSPDSFVPSSSPESVADMEICRYPDLSFIKLEPPSPCPSPTLPIMPSTFGKGRCLFSFGCSVKTMILIRCCATVRICRMSHCSFCVHSVAALKQEVKAEPNHQGPPSCSNTDLVTIAITLNPLAAQVNVSLTLSSSLSLSMTSLCGSVTECCRCDGGGGTAAAGPGPH